MTDISFRLQDCKQSFWHVFATIGACESQAPRTAAQANSFAEYAPATSPETKEERVVAWFALVEDRPLFAFAGI
jgi:hypothetical protein